MQRGGEPALVGGGVDARIDAGETVDVDRGPGRAGIAIGRRDRAVGLVIRGGRGTGAEIGADLGAQGRQCALDGVGAGAVRQIAARHVDRGGLRETRHFQRTRRFLRARRRRIAGRRRAARFAPASAAGRRAGRGRRRRPRTPAPAPARPPSNRAVSDRITVRITRLLPHPRIGCLRKWAKMWTACGAHSATIVVASCNPPRLACVVPMAERPA